MDEQGHKDFLNEITKEVGKLIVDSANLNCFRKYDKIFREQCKVYCQSIEQDRQAAEPDSRLRNKKAGPPKKDWVWYDQELSKAIPKGYWRRPEKDLPPNPLHLLSFPKGNIIEFLFPPHEPKHQIGKFLPAYYAFLTVIHDHDDYRVDDIKINNGIWPENEDWVNQIVEEISWKNFMELEAGNRLRTYIELILEHVKADLASEQKKGKGMNGDDAGVAQNAGTNAAQQDMHKTFPKYPFKSKLDKADEFLYLTPDHTESEIYQKAGGSLQTPLTKEQLAIIDKTVGSYEVLRIKAFLIQNCHITDPTPLSWSEVIIHLETYLHSQQAAKADLAEKPAEVEQVRQYAEAVRKLSLGVEIENQKVILMDDNHVIYGATQPAPDEKGLKRQKTAYKKGLLFLLGRDFTPIRRLFERKMPAKVTTLEKIRDEIVDVHMKGFDWIEADNRLQPDFSTGVTLDLFVDELLDGAGYLESLEKEAPAKTKRLPNKRTTKKAKVSESQVEHSLPLPMTKWAYIFGVSSNTLRQLRKGKKYHFRKVSPRRWTLPKSELPAEYLEKYRQAAHP